MLAINFIFPVHDITDFFFNVYSSVLFIFAGPIVVSHSPAKQKNSASVKRRDTAHLRLIFKFYQLPKCKLYSRSGRSEDLLVSSPGQSQIKVSSQSPEFNYVVGDQCFVFLLIPPAQIHI